MVTKCLEHLNCPSELGLYFDAPVPTTVHLKDLISCQFLNGRIPPKFTLNFNIAAHAVVTVIDDLQPHKTPPGSFLWDNKLNFTLHQHSNLTYVLQASNKEVFSPQEEVIIEKDITFTLNGIDAHVTATITCQGSGNALYKFKTKQEHQAQHTTSTCIIKSAMTDQAKIISNNLIKIHKNCPNVSAQQLCKNLLLGPGAKAMAIPQLEIETDNVHCRHDATVSRINQEHLFYLQSRGMTFQQAQITFINGFLTF